MIRWRKAIFIAAFFILLSCRSLPSTPIATVSSTTPNVVPSPTLAVDTLSPGLPTPRPTPTQVTPDTGWLTLQPGLERRTVNIISASGEWQENITILRLDPAHFRFDVRYQPDEPKDLIAWQVETGALLVVNGGFFTEEHRATGLVITKGQSSGVSYEGFGGMFAVTENGPELWSLLEQPFTGNERIMSALQSFPILLTSSGGAAVSSDDGDRARRTVVARDNQGRILFLVATFGHFTLYELSNYLATSELDLEVALNLDGGKSSGLLLSDSQLHIPAFVLLPTVITVYERD